jgi:heptosyltransferase-2
MKIAVFCPNWVGDVVMATPALRALRDHFADATIIGLMKPYVAGLLDGAPWLDQVWFLDRRGPWAQRWPAVALRLRRARVDLAVLFPNSFRSAWVAWLGGCRDRIGFDRYARGPLLTCRLAAKRDRHGGFRPRPVIHDYTRLAEAAGCPAPSFRMELFTTPADEEQADQLWDQTGLARCREVVCLNPGAAFGAAKFWPREHFISLARNLCDERGCGVLVLCGPSERELARQIAAEANRPKVHSVADYQLSLGLTKACIRRADLLITTDSGPRHFAAAFQRPVVTLFGPTHIGWTETYFPHAIHLQKPVPCGPCQLRVCPLDHRCMKELTPAEVLEAAQRLLPPQRMKEAG